MPVVIRHDGGSGALALQGAGNIGQFGTDRILYDEYQQDRQYRAGRDDVYFNRRLAEEEQRQRAERLAQEQWYQQAQVQNNDNRLTLDYDKLKYDGFQDDRIYRQNETENERQFRLERAKLLQKPELQEDKQSHELYKQAEKYRLQGNNEAARNLFQAAQQQERLENQRAMGTERDQAAMQRAQYVQDQINQRSVMTESRLATAKDDNERLQILSYDEQTLGQDIQRFNQESNAALQQGDQNKYNSLRQIVGDPQNPAPGTLLGKLQEVRSRKQQFLQARVPQTQPGAGRAAMQPFQPQTQPAMGQQPPAPPMNVLQGAAPDPGNGRVFQSPGGRQYTISDIMQTAAKYGIPPEEVIRRAGLR
jgi:hypothetical protein